MINLRDYLRHIELFLVDFELSELPFSFDSLLFFPLDSVLVVLHGHPDGAYPLLSLLLALAREYESAFCVVPLVLAVTPGEGYTVRNVKCTLLLAMGVHCRLAELLHYYLLVLQVMLLLRPFIQVTNRH